MNKQKITELLEKARNGETIRITKEIVGSKNIGEVALEVAKELSMEGYDVKVIAENEDSIRIEARKKVFGLALI
ncbi:MAG: hypothetical protein ACP6IS_06535 [Candidatus Asgardarchaeia archaeon]